MGRNNLFVHCGLHKTGTTALQDTLAEHRDLLAERGVLYPCGGGGYSGQHNLAWEIAGDRRFDPELLTTDRLLDEITSFNGDVVISSEDFETVLGSPLLLKPLIEAIQERHRQACLIIYLRDPTDYAGSLYIELLQHGYTSSFSVFHRAIKAGNGVLRFRDWVFHFDPASIKSELLRMYGARVVFRPYDQVNRTSSTIADFLDVIGLGGILSEEATTRRTILRPPIDESLRRFCEQGFGRPLETQEKALVARLCGRSLSSRLAAGPRFGLSEKRLLSEARVARLERVCSTVTLRTVRLLATLKAPMPIARILEAALVAWWCPR